MGSGTRRAASVGFVSSLVSLMLLGGGMPAAADVEELSPSTQEVLQPTEEYTDPDEPPNPEQPTSTEPADTSGDTDAEDSSPGPTETSSPYAPAEESREDADETDNAADEPEEPRSEPSAPQERQMGPSAESASDDGSATIVVNVGGDRTGATSVGELGGVRLRLHDGDSGGPGAPVNEAWATCISDSDGDCSFIVPDTKPGIWLGWWMVPRGVNYDRRFWVVAESTPAGWYMNDELVTGGPTTPGTTKYAFRTGSDRRPFVPESGVRSGNTYRSGIELMSAGSSAASSQGTWQASRLNPQLLQTCEAGLDVALVLDLSSSVSSSLGDLRDASKDMTEALAGTGSSLALFTFGTRAPMNAAGSGRNYAPVEIDEGDNLQIVKNRIDGYQAGTSHAGGTNWDQGIYQVAASGTTYDLAIVVTDGMPTFYGPGGNPAGPGNSTRFVEVEQAIFSANALKSQGTRVLAVGVGDGVSGGAANLRAISGPTSYASAQSAHEADYFQTGWHTLSGLLEEVARGATCQANIEVTKETTAYGEDVPGSGGADWEFTATSSSGSITPHATQSTDGNGQVEYALKFETPTAAPALVAIEEILNDESWSLEDIRCTVNGVPVEAGSAQADLTVAPGDDVACTFHNVEQLVPEISIEKQAWDTSNAEELGDADEISAGSELLHGSTVTWTYTVLNTGETRLDDIRVTDDQLAEDAVQCPRDSLEPNESMVCTATGAVTADP